MATKVKKNKRINYIRKLGHYLPPLILSRLLLFRYMNFMFDLEDASDDGAIDAAEFAIVCSSYGLDKAECEDAFRKMSQVSFQELAH